MQFIKFKVGITYGGSGWFAVLWGIEDSGFRQPYQTGFGRFESAAEARREAVCMAAEYGYPLTFAMNDEEQRIWDDLHDEDGECCI